MDQFKPHFYKHMKILYPPVSCFFKLYWSEIKKSAYDQKICRLHHHQYHVQLIYK